MRRQLTRTGAPAEPFARVEAMTEAGAIASVPKQPSSVKDLTLRERLEVEYALGLVYGTA